MKKIILFIIFLFLIKVVVVRAVGANWYQVQDGGVRANVIKNTISDNTKAFSVGINSDNGFVMGGTIDCVNCKFGSPTNDWRVDGSKVIKPEVVTLGKMKELESRLPVADRSQYFCFLKNDNGDYSQSDFNPSCKFFVIAGKAKIKADVNSIKGALIVVPSSDKAFVEFEDGGLQQLVITGMLYSAGDIKFNRSNGDPGVKVIYDPSFIFDTKLKNIFMDLTNWKQGI